jgi:hypothetical protein
MVRGLLCSAVMRSQASFLVMVLASAFVGGACERQTTCMPPAAGHDVGACAVAADYLFCEGSSGGCGCLSDDRGTCSSDVGCGPTNGSTCSSTCAAGEYVMACGGPPRQDGVTYEQAPSRCRFVSAIPSGTGFYCCPCS